jgi:hypothetical protein
MGWQVIIEILVLPLAGFHRNQWQGWTGIFIKDFKNVFGIIPSINLL